MSADIAPNIRVTVDIKAQLLAHVKELESAHDYAYPSYHFDEDRAHAALQRIKGVRHTLQALINSITINPQ